MKQLLKRNINRVTEYITQQVLTKSSDMASLADMIAFRVALETMLHESTNGKKPNEIFYGISDDFWFWLYIEGVKSNYKLRNILPSLPDENIQVAFNGAKGYSTLLEANIYYKIFKEQYQKYRGDISNAASILDFGCGWGRITRFFIKDLDGSKIWGCDPVEEMIKPCKDHNKWCNFTTINTSPPTPFQENTFDLIFSFSVFSHLSEDLHLALLTEIKRILKPGGIYITTTRDRKFMESCTFADKQQKLQAFDQGLYCHYSFNEPDRLYWGETAISKKYVLDNWTQNFTFLDYIENTQNIIVVQKPTVDGNTK